MVIIIKIPCEVDKALWDQFLKACKKHEISPCLALRIGIELTIKKAADREKEDSAERLVLRLHKARSRSPLSRTLLKEVSTRNTPALHAAIQELLRNERETKT